MNRPRHRLIIGALIAFVALAPQSGCDAKRGSAFPNNQWNVLPSESVTCERVVEFYLPARASFGKDDYPTEHVVLPAETVEALFADAKWESSPGTTVGLPGVKVEAKQVTWRKYMGSRSYTEYTAGGYRVTIACVCSVAPDAAPGDYKVSVVFPHMRTALQKEEPACSPKVVSYYSGDSFAPDNRLEIAEFTVHASSTARLFNLYGRWALYAFGAVLVLAPVLYLAFGFKQRVEESDRFARVSGFADSLMTFDVSQVAFWVWVLLLASGAGAVLLARYALEAFANDLPAAAIVTLSVLCGLGFFIAIRRGMKALGFRPIRSGEPARAIPSEKASGAPGRWLKCNFCGSLFPPEPTPERCEWCQTDWSGSEVFHER